MLEPSARPPAPTSARSKPATGSTRKLTARVLERLQPGEIARDATVRGLFAEAGSRGVSLKLQADYRPGPRNGAARERSSIRMTLGKWPALSLDDARTQAMALLAEIRAGRDPRRATPAPIGPATCGAMLADYAEHLRTRKTPAAPRTIKEFDYFAGKYLVRLAPVAVADVKPSTLRELHRTISEENGPTVANKAMRLFSAAYNLARDRSDDPASFQERITRAVELHAEPRREAVLLPAELPEWFRKVRGLPNPLRAAMHELGLFSGLRPDNLMTLERAWIDLDARMITIPRSRMKHRKPDRGDFLLPLSEHMTELVRRALAAGEGMFPGSPFLFPTRARKGTTVVATKVVRERPAAGLPPHQLGHVLRHTWRTMALAAEVDPTTIEILLDHSIPGVQGTYLHPRALGEHLAKAQERVSSHILGLSR